jgi:hypothetical protein
VLATQFFICLASDVSSSYDWTIHLTTSEKTLDHRFKNLLNLSE